MREVEGSWLMELKKKLETSKSLQCEGIPDGEEHKEITSPLYFEVTTSHSTAL